MKRWVFVFLAAATLALLPTGAAADDERGGGGGSNQFGPFASTSTDSGTCGNDWANDTFKREFFVQQTGPATWRVTEAFIDGHFTTIGGASPGACETGTPHGVTVLPLKTGTFAGFLTGTVTGGTYNPGGCDTAPAACTTTSGFITVVFPGGAYSCVTGVGACSFYFDYRARDQGLVFRHWVNASADFGGNRGDIASV